MAQEVAVRKRALIDQANKNMLIVVAAASVVLGITLVATIYLTKKIAFNASVIGEKGQIIDDYNTSLSNIGKLDSAVQALATDANLESVALTRASACANVNPAVTTPEVISECTALRVIPDALPAVDNPEALLASLNKIFLQSGTAPESLAPSDSSNAVSLKGIETIPVRLSISGDSTLTRTVLDNIEKSIRTFEMGNVTIEWRGASSILLRGQASAFYSTEITAAKKDKTICADDKSKDCTAANKGSTTKK